MTFMGKLPHYIFTHNFYKPILIIYQRCRVLVFSQISFYVPPEKPFPMAQIFFETTSKQKLSAVFEISFLTFLIRQQLKMFHAETSNSYRTKQLIDTFMEIRIDTLGRRRR